MVKIAGPLMSHTAHGAVAKNLVFSFRKSGQQARFQYGQKDVITNSRTLQRENYKSAVSGWNSLSAGEKISWAERAQQKHMTGYNLYMRYALLYLFPVHAPSIFGVAIFGDTIFGDV